ncbi:DUF1616 domain-containing protein [Halorussus amylolyticus]|uniref:DUF1616 domain-containing protein n=1 Tax=Halorussus amylolyticus TaxID=1126242 RepID=UPI00104C00D0|nr:DUF1616 domain-containing protein [Halorussus amylolyticus]
MGPVRRTRVAVSRFVRNFPADLAATVALAVLAGGAVTLPGVRETPVPFLFAFPFALFAPGYAVVAVLFPERGGVEWADERDAITFPHTKRRIGGLERATLSVAVSVGVVPVLGILLVLTGAGLTLVPVVAVVGGFTLVTSVAAAIRRSRLPPENRFRVPYRRWVASARTALGPGDSRTDTALNVVLVLSVLAAASSVGYAVAVHEQGEPFTEFYLATENGTGALAADGYPANVTLGETQSVVVGISNHEREATDYSTVVLLQRVAPENGSVVESNRLDGFDVRVPANETAHVTHEVRPNATGDRLRLQFLLYRGDPPQDPTRENAYRRTHVWTDVRSTAETWRWRPRRNVTRT